MIELLIYFLFKQKQPAISKKEEDTRKTRRKTDSVHCPQSLSASFSFTRSFCESFSESFDQYTCQCFHKIPWSLHYLMLASSELDSLSIEQIEYRKRLVLVECF